MITVVIPTLDADAGLPATLTALVPATIEGLVRQVIVVDAGSTDKTRAIADEMGATILTAEPSRGGQMRVGAAAASQPWLLFLHADTVLAPGWERVADDFIARVDADDDRPRAAAFRYALDDVGLAARCVEIMVRLRCLLLALPFGDQGLLIPKHLYGAIGGYRDMPLMEDVELVRRLGRKRLAVLPAHALTSARRYRREGYAKRVLRNQMCLAAYFAGVPVPRIARLYAPRASVRTDRIKSP